MRSLWSYDREGTINPEERFHNLATSWRACETATLESDCSVGVASRSEGRGERSYLFPRLVLDSNLSTIYDSAAFDTWSIGWQRCRIAPKAYAP